MATFRELGVHIAALIFSLSLAFPPAAFAQQIGEADSAAIQGVIHDQIEAFKAGDHDRAYSYAAPAIRDIFPTVDRFIEMVQQGYMVLYRPAEYRFGRSTEVDGEIYQEVIATDAAGKLWQAVYTLRRQDDGTWKITGVKLNPYNGASA